MSKHHLLRLEGIVGSFSLPHCTDRSGFRIGHRVVLHSAVGIWLWCRRRASKPKQFVEAIGSAHRRGSLSWAEQVWSWLATTTRNRRRGRWSASEAKKVVI
jgi:hypothetical protein